MWGLAWIDVIVVLAYLFGMLYVGKLVGKKVHEQGDFYLAGRKLGKLFQFFLNFGNMTDANGAASTCSVVYKQGIGGVWIALQTLFMTPYYWFMNVWFRRARLITVADLFEDRFGGRGLAMAYAGFNLVMSIAIVGWGYKVSCKTMEAMMVKPYEQCTPQQQQIVDDYKEYVSLKEQFTAGTLAPEDRPRYETLSNLAKQGDIRSYVSYVNPLVFYIIYGAVVGIYIVLGGFAAAAITDAFQAILIIVFSLMLIPFGLSKLGGLTGLHDTVPDTMFRIFGAGGASEYTWYSILAILFTSIVQIHAVSGNMAIGGSAKNEMAARVGAVSGGFAKRFMIIAWSFCALIAVGLYAGNPISDPDTAWGTLTKDLLTPGMIGFMLAGILAANMSTLDAGAINVSALFVRNLYMPLARNRSEKHYMVVGRISTAVILVVGIFVALRMGGVISMLKIIITMNVTFGAPILLMFFWRKLSKSAVVVEVIACILLVLVIPTVVPAVASWRQAPELTIETNPQTIVHQVKATSADVEAGLAPAVGAVFDKSQNIEPVSVFFEKVVNTDPYDTSSPLQGAGRFNVEVYIMSKLGLDVRNMTPAGLLTTRFLFDGIFPFVVLSIISFFTKAADKQRMDRFFVKMKTPVADTPEADVAELEKSYAEPTRFDHTKLFPKSNWEMCKWTRHDAVGFVLCWVVVVVILCFLYLILHLGA